MHRRTSSCIKQLISFLRYTDIQKSPHGSYALLGRVNDSRRNYRTTFGSDRQESFDWWPSRFDWIIQQSIQRTSVAKIVAMINSVGMVQCYHVIDVSLTFVRTNPCHFTFYRWPRNRRSPLSFRQQICFPTTSTHAHISGHPICRSFLQLPIPMI